MKLEVLILASLCIPFVLLAQDATHTDTPVFPNADFLLHVEFEALESNPADSCKPFWERTLKDETIFSRDVNCGSRNGDGVGVVVCEGSTNWDKASHAGSTFH